MLSARDVRLPTLSQLSQVFDELPDEPKGPVKKLGPQYERPTTKRNYQDQPSSGGLWHRLLSLFQVQHNKPRPQTANPMGMLRNGDRALIVAVNDSGNTGWVRFGRTGFSEHVVI
jgi:tRNA-splicing endonuclease subunit Sen54